jgi:hypothetical protein
LNTNHRASGRSPVAAARALRWLSIALSLVIGAHAGISAAADDAPPAAAKKASKRAAPGRPVFDHLKTGFELLGYHKQVKCEECHVKGVFRGTPRQCSTCHAVGSRFLTATTMSPKHFQVGSKPCDDCHVPSDWTSVNVRHDSGMIGKCLSCHDRTHASGQPANHLATKQTSCDYCHDTLSWHDHYFDHSVLVTTAGSVSSPRCDSCHNGSTAPTHGSLHIPTSGADCIVCHGNPPANAIMVDSALSYWAVGSFDHTNPAFAATVAVCSYCHNNTLEVGKGTGTPAHIVTSGECRLCHKTTSNTKNGGLGFAGAQMDHTGIAGGCSRCHSGQTFQGATTVVDHGPAASGSLVAKTASHFTTSLACETCHAAANFSSFSGTAMNHTGIAAGCKSCHAAAPTTTTTVQYNAAVLGELGKGSHIPTTQVSDVCETCHTITTTGGFLKATMSHQGISPSGACTTCHEATVSFADLSNVVKGPAAAGQLVVRPVGQFSNGYDHPASGECSTCHNSFTTFTSVIAGAGIPAGHIPSTQTCTLCHAAGYGLGLTQMDHTGSGATCAGCHGATFTTTINGAAGAAFVPVGMTTTGVSHIPVNGGTDCSVCHQAAAPKVAVNSATPTYSAGGTFKVASYIGNLHSYVSTSTCANCHSGSTSFTGISNVATIAAAVGSLTTQPTTVAGCSTGAGSGHGAMGECSNCHLASQIVIPSSSSTGFCTVGTPAGHIATTQPCALCHAGGYGMGKTVMDHTGITSCIGCHNGQTLTTAGVSVTPVNLASVNHMPLANAECVNCHVSGALKTTVSSATPTYTTGAAFKVAAYKANLHSYVSTSTCSTCHSGSASFTGMANISTIAAAVGSLTTQPATIAGCSTGQGSAHGALGECATCHTAASIVIPSTSSTGFCGITLPTGHFATTQACSLCHAAGYAMGKTVMDHTGITTCVSCHNGQTLSFGSVTVKPVNLTSVSHMPLANAECVNCHVSGALKTTVSSVTPTYTVGSAFKVASYAANLHSYVSTSTCANCHSGSASFTGMANIGTIAAAVGSLTTQPTTVAGCATGNGGAHGALGECATCHTAASIAVPSGTSTGFCTSALPSGHFATTQPCSLCHATGYALGKSVMDHTGITTCVSCHNGQTLSFGTTTVKPVNLTSVTHMPLTSAECVNCHVSGALTTTVSSASPTYMVGSGFKVASYAANLHAYVSTSSCAGCHSGSAKFTGMNNIATIAASVGSITTQPATVAGCSTGVGSSHGALGECVTCHTAASIVIPSSSSTGFCGITLPTGHFATTQACSLCHAAGYALGKTVMDHTGITTCVSCHNGQALAFGSVTVTPVNLTSVTHMPLTAPECVNCHVSGALKTTVSSATPTYTVGTAFKVASYAANLHAYVSTSSCASCHSGSAKFTGMNNITTIAAAVGSITTQPATVAGCSTAVGSSHGALGECVTCHTAASIVIPSSSSTGFCGITLPAGHFATTQSCALCHAAGYAIGKTVMDHTGITTCVSCHNGQTLSFGSVTVTPVNLASVTHMPLSAPECVNCHVSGALKTTVSSATPTYTTGTAFKVASYKANLHTYVSTSTCSTCHSGSTSFTGMANITSISASVGSITTQPATIAGCAAGNGGSHGAIGECATCHLASQIVVPSGTSTGFCTSALPAGHFGTTQPCSLCHSAGYSLGTTVMDHTGISTCVSCHNGQTLSFGTTTVKPVNLTSVSHMPLANAECVNCHVSGALKTTVSSATPTYAAGGTFKVASYAANLHSYVSTSTCANCHAGSTSFTGMANIGTIAAAVGSLTVQPTTVAGCTTAVGNSHGALGECSTCHLASQIAVPSTSSTGFCGITLPTGHFATTQPCSLCHAAGYVLGKTVMDHTGITTCVSCHNGQTLSFGSTTVKPVNLTSVTHMPLTAPECVNCHVSGALKTTVSSATPTYTVGNAFKVASYVANLHAYVSTSSCTACHSGSAKFSGMTNITSIAAAVGSLTVQPTTVAGCTTAVGNSHGALGECATCHLASQIAVPSTSSSGFCGITLPTGHFATTQACALCHAAGYALGKTVMDHTGITTCVSCHNGQTLSFGSVTVTPVNLTSVTHMPLTAPECVNCHVSGALKTTVSSATPTYTVGTAFKVASYVVNLHAYVSTSSCASCHSGSAKFTGMNNITTIAAAVGSLTVQPVTVAGCTTAAGSSHGALGECVTCHVASKIAVPSTSSSGFCGITLPAGHFATTQACSLCHAAGYALGKSIMDHTGISTCVSCHNGQTLSFGSVTVRPVNLASVTHMPLTNAECVNCHVSGALKTTVSSATPTYATGTAFKVASYAANLHSYVSTSTCSTCHSGSTSFTGMVNISTIAAAVGSITVQPNTVAGCTTAVGNSHGALGECATCHLASQIAVPSTSSTGFCGITLPAGHFATTQPCALCHAAGYALGKSVMDHTGISTCVSCHNGQTLSFGSVSVRPVNLASVTHMPLTNAECVNCHVSGALKTTVSSATPTYTTGAAFKVASYVANLHAYVSTSSCASCHSGSAKFTGMNNIGTIAAAVGSLTVQPTTVAGCTTAAGNSHGALGECVTCHLASQIAVPSTASTGFCGITLPAGHFATTQACSLCHAAGYALGKSIMDHTGISTCVSCHNGQTLSFGSVTVKPVNLASVTHMPLTNAECVNCHVSGALKTTVSSATPTYTTGKAFKVTSYVANLHAYVSTSTCASCHSGSAKFTGMNNITTIAAAVGSLTVQPVTVAGCTTANGSNHGALGECVTCHLASKIAVPSTSSSGFCGITLPAGHFATTQACSLCHVAGYALGKSIMDHTGITTCVSCHNGQTLSFGSVTVKPVNLASVNHMPLTAAECVNCHVSGALKTTVSSATPTYTTGAAFKVASYKANLHSFVSTATCLNCHGSGTSFTGMSSKITTIAASVGSIVVTPATIADCTTGKGTTHAAASECSSCHLASQIAVPSTVSTGFCNPNVLPSSHFPVTGACSLCHAAGYGLGKSVMNHSGVGLSSCNGCHNGTAMTIDNSSFTPVSTNSVSHIALTSGDCINCHTAANLPTKTVNATQTYTAPGGFRVTSYVGNLHSYVNASTCISCHSAAKSYTGMSTTTAIAAAVGAIVINPATVNGCSSANGSAHVTQSECSFCHTQANIVIPSTPTTGFCAAIAIPANHMPNPANLACTACHTNATNPYGTGLAVMNHTGTTGVCLQCHVANSFVNNPPANPIYTMTSQGSHIPTSLSCDRCHTAPSAALAPLTGFKITINNSSLSTIHTALGGAASACSTCHAVGSSYYGVTMVDSPSNHIPNPGGIACPICHTNATSSSYAIGSWRFTSQLQMVHTGIAGGCITCHGANSYASDFLVKSTAYAGASTWVINPATYSAGYACSTTLTGAHPGGECSGCHSSTSIPSGGKTGFCDGTSFPSNHIPLSASQQANCALCHSAGYTPSTTQMNHTGGLACTTCHGTTSGLAFKGTTPVWATQPGAHIPLPGGAYGTWTTACNTCHTAPAGAIAINGSGTQFVTASGSRILHSHVTIVTGQCNACHRTTVSIKPVGGEKITTSSHNSPTSCDGGTAGTCHTHKQTNTSF